MGMFDKRKNLTGDERFNAGQEFVLTRAKYDGKQNSADYGENDVASVTVHELGQEDTLEFIVFGVLAQQISRMDSGDIPAVVKLGKDGRAHVWSFVRKPTEQDSIPF